ncbi:hypothetical protein AALO_G00295160 [Alosa alosa]|uniref:Ubiquitin-like domain-containing protein n=1 Tax=Alosa alosa TaxID=278164 RepID=A0AAV6FD25_9TELE|nr:ubiquitin [Alosa sapidissima]XP_048092767.1 ubiquitin [Alosa alosa]KAG5260673.1 hypothetical protein AALO_G00295160 [Alosa alosa]
MGKIYQLTVVGIQGEKKTVDVATTEEDFNNTTILVFKKKLIEKLPGNIDPSELRVLYAAKQLEDNDKLSDHGIKDKSTLMLVLRLHGGWTHIYALTMKSQM